MAKKRSPSRTLKNAKAKKPAPAVMNDLSSAILGFNPGSIGTALQQVTTAFINLRWYLVSNFRQVLNEVYAEHGLVQTLVDVPVDDGLRGGFDIKSEQLSPDQVTELLAYVDREDLTNRIFGQSMKWNRLFGGAGIVIITDQDPSMPLDLNAIGPESKLEFRAVDMWELFWDRQNADGYDPAIETDTFTHYSYYSVQLHKSRVIKLKGIEAPSFIRPRLRGWGLSVVECLVSSLNQYFKSSNLTFELLDEAKVDVFKIKGLSNAVLSAAGTEAIHRRVQIANQEKNYNNALTMDTEDDYIQKQLTFAGIAEVMREIRIGVAADLRMPMSKLFGVSASGLQSGEDDIEVYNGMVEGQVRSKIKYPIIYVLRIVCAKLFGFIPDDLGIEFESLRILSATDEETVKTQQFQRLLQAVSANKITDDEFRDGCNKAQLFPIQLDKDVRLLEDSNESKDEEAAKEGEDV
jgi:uncharacterized protein